jgi:MFS family permease
VPDARRIARRFLVLQAVRWLPTGLLLPVLVLFLTGKGLSLAQVGAVIAAQGVVTFLLELPTGGLADAWGRRPVMVVAVLFELASLSLFIVGQDLAVLLLAGALQGVYRALDSGPVDSWFVDRTLAHDPDADFERTLVHGSVIVGIAMATGALAGGGLVAWAPLPGVNALAVPFLAALALRLVEIVAVISLLHGHHPIGDTAAEHTSPVTTVAVVRLALRSAHQSAALKLLLLTALLWGIASTSFEVLPPIRLEDQLDSADRAAAILGPLNAGAWAAAAIGAAIAARARRRFAPVQAAAALLTVQAVAVAGMAFSVGLTGLTTAYLLTYTAHGGANPLLAGLAHRAIPAPTHRTTIISAISMAAMIGGAVGSVLLGRIADLVGTTGGMLAGTAMLLAGAVTTLRLGRHTSGPQPATATRTSPWSDG